MIKQIEEKIAELERQKGSDSNDRGGCPTDPPSNAMVVAPGYNNQDQSGYGGDPRNSYREIRRYLLSKGIDTRIFSFGTIPIPMARSGQVISFRRNLRRRISLSATILPSIAVLSCLTMPLPNYVIARASLWRESIG